jgi:hypothetical protein
LIKNNYGDWGIVTAHWTGFRRGIPRVHGLNSELHVKLIWCLTALSTIFQIL